MFSFTKKIAALAGVCTFVVTSILLQGCAGSANHKVVTENQIGDEKISCQKIDSEIVKTQVIIDGVNNDKEDVSGADVIDGILWFPFNLIAKHSNYDSALKAADKRLAKLGDMKKQNNCIVAEDSDKTNQKVALISGKIKELNKMHSEGTITESEYKVAKQKLLDSLAVE